jgi:hypothetical protein
MANQHPNHHQGRGQSHPQTIHRKNKYPQNIEGPHQTPYDKRTPKSHEISHISSTQEKKIG